MNNILWGEWCLVPQMVKNRWLGRAIAGPWSAQRQTSSRTNSKGPGGWSWKNRWGGSMGTQGISNSNLLDYIRLVVWNFFYFSIYIGNNNPNWQIFFRGVVTTNQICIIYILNYTLENGESNWQLTIDIFRCVFCCHELMWICWIFFGSFSNMGQDKMSKKPTSWVVFDILPEYCDTVLGCSQTWNLYQQRRPSICYPAW